MAIWFLECRRASASDHLSFGGYGDHHPPGPHSGLGEEGGDRNRECTIAVAECGGHESSADAAGPAAFSFQLTEYLEIAHRHLPGTGERIPGAAVGFPSGFAHFAYHWHRPCGRGAGTLQRLPGDATDAVRDGAGIFDR